MERSSSTIPQTHIFFVPNIKGLAQTVLTWEGKVFADAAETDWIAEICRRFEKKFVEKIVLWFKFDWCLFLYVQWTVSQHLFDHGLATKRWPSPESMIAHFNQNWVSSIASMTSNVAEKYLSSGPVFLSLARSKLRLCSANHRPGYWSNLPCDWRSTAWASSKQETGNGPRSISGQPVFLFQGKHFKFSLHLTECFLVMSHLLWMK